MSVSEKVHTLVEDLIYKLGDFVLTFAAFGYLIKNYRLKVILHVGVFDEICSWC